MAALRLPMIKDVHVSSPNFSFLKRETPVATRLWGREDETLEAAGRSRLQ
jgi:hypothetical protein